jgi:hypothetical protein
LDTDLAAEQRPEKVVLFSDKPRPGLAVGKGKAILCTDVSMENPERLVLDDEWPSLPYLT